MNIISENKPLVYTEEKFGYDKHSCCLNCKVELLPRSVYSYHGYCSNCVDFSFLQGVALKLDVCLTSGKSFMGRVRNIVMTGM